MDKPACEACTAKNEQIKNLIRRHQYRRQAILELEHRVKQLEEWYHNAHKENVELRRDRDRLEERLVKLREHMAMTGRSNDSLRKSLQKALDEKRELQKLVTGE